jgi:uncharacterized protein (TIGR02271 family)
MTMHADQLMGATVTDSEGVPVGTIEQVFRDDVDGTPSWARIRSAQGLHFVPLAGSKVTRGGGLDVPFDSRKILGAPQISVDRHMSVEQEEQLRRYFGIKVPAQATWAEAQARRAQNVEARAAQRRAGEAQAAEAQAGEAQASEAQADEALVREADAGEAQAEPALAEPALAEPALAEHAEAGNEWVIRSEERLAVDLETSESGRVTVRKYVDAEPVQQTVRVFHEELEIERVPISDDDDIASDMAEYEQEVVLHEARAKITKETVPVERVKLSVRKVEEDKTVSGEIRKERIEVVDDGSAAHPPRR